MTENNALMHTTWLTAVFGLLAVFAPLALAQPDDAKNPKVAHMTLFRSAASSGKSVTHIEINGRYHTSLQPGAFSEVCLLARKVKVAVNLVYLEANQRAGAKTTQQIAIAKGQNIYVRVDDEGDKTAEITPVTEQVAQASLATGHRQTHAITRVPNLVDCDSGTHLSPIDTADADVKKITLQTDAILRFAFGKSTLQGVTPKGRVVLDRLIADLNREHNSTHDMVQIKVVGHADLLGHPVSNQRLSEARAKTIQAYLVENGLRDVNLTSEGRGDTEPALATCGRANIRQDINCNKKNRRVVIHIQKTAQ